MITDVFVKMVTCYQKRLVKVTVKNDIQFFFASLSLQYFFLLSATPYKQPREKSSSVQAEVVKASGVQFLFGARKPLFLGIC